jgi:subtilisin family serine protease
LAAPTGQLGAALGARTYSGEGGDSAATPIVANVAAKMRDLNPRLSAAEVKEILVETVDRSAAFASRTSSGGALNEERALATAVERLTAPRGKSR